MQKVLNFLESHVQWVALGLAALFLLFMLVSYGLNNPVTANLGSETVSLGNVDQTINEQLVPGLRRDTSSTVVPKLPEPVKSNDFSATMSREGQTYATIDNNAVFPNRATSEVVPERLTPRGPREREWVEALPVPPAPKLVDEPLTGRSQVSTAPYDPRTGPRPAYTGAQPAYPGAPGYPAVPGYPAGVPARPGAPAGTPGATVATVEDETAEDRVWVTAFFHIDIAGIANEFSTKGVSRVVPSSTTMFLELELVRQELDIDDSVLNETVVATLPYNELREAPAGAGQAEDFLIWAKANQQNIIQPPFYPIIRGDMWYLPGEEPDLSQVADRPLTEEEILQLKREDYLRREEERRRNANTPRSSTPGGAMPPGAMPPGMGGPGGGRGNTPRGGRGARPLVLPPENEPHLQAQPPMLPPDMMFPPGAMPPGAMPPGMMPPGAMPPGMMPPGAFPGQSPTAINTAEPGGGEFIPRQSAEPLLVWAHDETAKPGKTYRYALRYKLKNPIYKVGNAARPEALSDELAIESELSEWSAPVTIPVLTHYRIAGGLFPGSNRINFQVFKWEGGKQQAQTFSNISPGEIIGGVRNDIDYTTNATLVDLREDMPGGEIYAIIARPDGTLERRNVRSDQANELFRSLQADIDRQAAAARAAENPTNPGGMPPGGMPPGMMDPGMMMPPGAVPPGAGTGGNRRTR